MNHCQAIGIVGVVTALPNIRAELRKGTFSPALQSWDKELLMPKDATVTGRTSFVPKGFTGAIP